MKSSAKIDCNLEDKSKVANLIKEIEFKGLQLHVTVRLRWKNKTTKSMNRAIPSTSSCEEQSLIMSVKNINEHELFSVDEEQNVHIIPTGACAHTCPCLRPQSAHIRIMHALM